MHLVRCMGVDMFPHTEHVEMITELRRCDENSMPFRKPKRQNKNRNRNRKRNRNRNRNRDRKPNPQPTKDEEMKQKTENIKSTTRQEEL